MWCKTKPVPGFGMLGPEHLTSLACLPGNIIDYMHLWLWFTPRSLFCSWDHCWCYAKGMEANTSPVPSENWIILHTDLCVPVPYILWTLAVDSTSAKARDARGGIEIDVLLNDAVNGIIGNCYCCSCWCDLVICLCIATCIVLGYLFNVGKAATEQVAKTAKQFRETVEEKVTSLHENFCTCFLICKFTIMNLVNFGSCILLLFLITVFCSALCVFVVIIVIYFIILHQQFLP